MSPLPPADIDRLFAEVVETSRQMNSAAASRMVWDARDRWEADRSAGRGAAQRGLFEQVLTISTWLEGELTAGRWDPDCALAAAVLAYYVRVYDMIPDSLGEPGLEDDAAVVSLVCGRLAHRWTA